MLQVFHDWRPVLLENSQSDKEVEITAVEIGPETFPQEEHVVPREFPLVPDQQHSEEEEEIRAVRGLEVKIELRVHELDKLVECCELEAHAGLIAEVVALLNMN
jgi:hypothetical protein